MSCALKLPTKVNGRAQYAIDVQLPGMLYGAVVRAPVEGAAPEKIDDAKVLAIAGVVKMVRLPYGVGVVAETPWAAFDAKRALAGSVTWTRTGKTWSFDSETGLVAFAAAARDLKRPGTDWFKRGDLELRLAQGRQHDGCDLSLRLCLSRADGAAECGRVGLGIGRRCRGLDRYPKPDHRVRRRPRRRSAFQPRQGQAQLLSDGRRLRPARPARFRLHRRCGAAGERGRQAGEGDVDARGRHPERALPAAVGALSARRLRSVRRSSWHGIIAMSATG